MPAAPDKPLLEHQLEFLKMETKEVEESIRQMNDITKETKQWAITLWSAAVGGCFAYPNLTKYAGFTALIAMLFWFVDARYRVIQRRFQ
jgi:hypothetical protein